MQVISIIAQTLITGNRSDTYKRYIRGEQISDLKYSNCFQSFFCVSCLPMPRRRHRGSFDQVSEFDRGRIVAYRDCELSFREIKQRVGRNQLTVMRTCNRWMQEETTDGRDRSPPLSHCP
ncbi:uncharacterized protein TNCV_4952531 [Trichonephila clavipes]|nr:uncharacterized protein TNCV_4952531 [Trichonephila clavipes]